MEPTNLMTCPITNRYMSNPALAPCGHMFEYSAIVKTQYCEEHNMAINPDSLRPDPLSREITFRVLLDKANKGQPEPPHRVILLSFTLPSENVSYHDNNLFYESIKRVGGLDRHYHFNLFDLFTGQMIQEPVTAPCSHTFDASSVPDEGVICPIDGSSITPRNVYPNLFITSYIQSLFTEEYKVPIHVEGVYLDLPLSSTMAELGKVALCLAGSNRFKNLQFTDGESTISLSTTLDELLSATPETIIPYVFAYEGTPEIIDT